MPLYRNGVEMMSCGHADHAITDKQIEQTENGFTPFYVKKESPGSILSDSGQR